MDKYHPFKGTTGTTGRSGAGLYIHKNLNPIPRPDLDFKYFEKENEEFESTWIEINNEHSPNIIIAAVYRHPTEKGEKFIEHLKKTLTKLKKEKDKFIAITGDFNHDLLKYGNDRKVTRFLNFMLEHHLHPCITEPTRIVDTSTPSLLDNIFTLNIQDPICGNILEKNILRPPPQLYYIQGKEKTTYLKNYRN